MHLNVTQVHFLLEWMQPVAINFTEIQHAKYFPEHSSKELENKTT